MVSLRVEGRFKISARQILEDTFAQDVASGLSGQPPTLPCRYFYDHQGSLLFEEICDQPEYYLTRAETEILKTNCKALARLLDVSPQLVELGSGSGVKTRLLIEALIERFGECTYVPIDISATMLEASAVQLLADYPQLSVSGICGEYLFGLKTYHDLVRPTHRGPVIYTWLGSNIGNLGRSEAAEFLGSLSNWMEPEDRLLMGIDLLKDQTILERAYNDEAGVTARFNLNLLERLNREVGSDFDLGQFAHQALFNADCGRIEMSLKSLCDQRIHLGNLGLHLEMAAGATIETEHCHKYSLPQIAELFCTARLHLERSWFDGEQRFVLTWGKKA